MSGWHLVPNSPLDLLVLLVALLTLIMSVVAYKTKQLGWGMVFTLFAVAGVALATSPPF